VRKYLKHQVFQQNFVKSIVIYLKHVHAW
jgi:hypothetical protein